VILVDANLLIYASIREMPPHEEAKGWLDRQLTELPKVGLPWFSLLAFVRLVTNPRVFEQALPVADAWLQVEEWLGVSAVWIPQPTERHQEILGDLIVGEGSVRANLVMDAHLAALAIEHGLTLCSADRDFARFPGLRWENPVQVTN